MWMVAAELIVVAGLVFTALSMVMGTRPAAQPPSAILPAPTEEQSPAPLPDLPSSQGAGARGPAPGLNVDGAFWRARLAQLNRDQVVMEELEWRLVHGAMEAARRYIELTVLPSIQRAEHAGGEVAA